ncbi:MAG TPA: adenylate/guanylate cyclase domain-containing protein, partial [Dehalococcoidia bacterium]|nr:adenylate/guanylate cyclase domain-containing protein [Dehalococcoidia bacterium]
MAERRLVSVLFADLVGFTPMTEDADPEAVREFLGRYFEAASQVIANYGGTVEKFIGDAVMAVWGSPQAHEDDAERAVRAALDLVETVNHLDDGGLTDDLKLRAGVLTGEAAVTIGAEQQGMVVGDMVNTASRIQSVAPPGTVLVGETTFRATHDAIAFEEAGEQVLKGKKLPVPVWRALRVVGKVGGAGRSERLEAPFIGRAEELRALKEAYHATVREGKARLVSVIGQAGLGKSRLAWEFSKYTDGLAETMRWHEGRSPAYGEGVAFWALGEMVRQRAGIAESDDPATSRAKLSATLVEYLADDDERRWIEPSLVGLLGLGETPSVDRQELYAAWRTLFERMAEATPVVLVFQDLHWADDGLLDFIANLLASAASLPILIVTFSRPDLLDRRTDWGAGQKRFVSVHLEPLDESEMAELLRGLAPGLPGEVVGAIVERAEGFPLYAVEIVRMLVNQGHLVPENGSYRLSGEVSSLAVPDTLHSLIAARLDGLDTAEKRLLQHAAVLGQSFTPAGLAALTGDDQGTLDPLLLSLVRKEFLRQEGDPRSPERGQYQFVQALIREVAYGTLARKDRRSRHLAAARYFEALGDDELAGILASHYLDAYRASPEGPEADALAAQARVALRGAAERAGALHSHEAALSYLEEALSVTPDPETRAALWEQAARSARVTLNHKACEEYITRALEVHESRGDHVATARLKASLASLWVSTGRVSEAVPALEEAIAALRDSPADAELAALTSELARASMFHEQFERGAAMADDALRIAERLELPEVIGESLVTKSTCLWELGRHIEGMAVLRGAVDYARANGLLRVELRALNNISFLVLSDDPREAMDVARPGFELARRVGQTNMAMWLLGNAVDTALHTGDWQWATDMLEETPFEDLGLTDLSLLVPYLAIPAFRGDDERVARWLDRFEEGLGTSSDPAYPANLALTRS